MNEHAEYLDYRLGKAEEKVDQWEQLGRDLLPRIHNRDNKKDIADRLRTLLGLPIPQRRSVW